MKKENKLCLSSVWLYSDLMNLTNIVVGHYYRELKPVLKAFGLLSDENIKRYLACDDMRPIYEDALAKDPGRFNFMEQISDYISEDLWAAFRDPECHVKNPKMEGFIFAQMPLAYNPLKAKVLRCLVVKDGELTESNEAMEKERLIYANEQQAALYDVVAEFCETVNANFGRWNPRELIYMDESGHLQPYLKGIMRNTQYL